MITMIAVMFLIQINIFVNLFLFRISDLMDLSAEDLTNSSLYSHIHAADLQKMKKAHTDCKLFLSSSYFNRLC